MCRRVPASASSSSATAKSGPLLGNFTATDLSTQLMSAVSGAAASGMSANAIGLTVSSTGSVSFDSSTFATAYAQNPSAVQALVSQIYTSLSGISKGAIGTSSGSGTATTGTIGAATSSLQSTVTSIDGQVTQMTKMDNSQIQQLINRIYGGRGGAVESLYHTELPLPLLQQQQLGLKEARDRHE